MSDNRESSENRKIYPIKVEYEAYVIPVVGIYFVAAAVLGAAVCLFMMTIGSLLHIPDAFAMTLVFGGAGGVVVLWIMHLRRVHTGRKIVLDDDGITYYHFADNRKFISWDSIGEFKIMDGNVNDNPSYCEVFVGNKRKLKFEHSDFDASEIINTVKRKIPNKVNEIKY